MPFTTTTSTSTTSKRFEQRTPGDVVRIDRYNEIIKNRKPRPPPPYGLSWREADRYLAKEQKKTEQLLALDDVDQQSLRGVSGDARSGGTAEAAFRCPPGQAGGPTPGAHVRIQEPSLEEEKRPTQRSWASRKSEKSSVGFRDSSLDTDGSFVPIMARKPLWYVKPNPGRQVILRDDILPLKRSEPKYGKVSSKTAKQQEAAKKEGEGGGGKPKLLKSETTMELAQTLDTIEPTTAEEIPEKERRYLLQGSSFKNLDEKQEYIKNSSQFESRLQSLLSKREEQAKRVAARFQGDLNAISDRWALKAPPLDIRYLMEGDITL
ncbi:unnamed protein product [Amoebophrya sp. A120]|nr:unnamed protein product [Amoebophrya sp. A120]|eukprot:GSA120T00007889001.1